MALTVADILKLFDDPNLALIEEVSKDGKPTGSFNWSYFDGEHQTQEAVYNLRLEEEHFEETDEIKDFYMDGQGLDFMSLEDWKIAGDGFLRLHNFAANKPVALMQEALNKVLAEAHKQLMDEIQASMPDLSEAQRKAVATFVAKKVRAARKELNDDWHERQRKWERNIAKLRASKS